MKKHASFVSILILGSACLLGVVKNHDRVAEPQVVSGSEAASTNSISRWVSRLLVKGSSPIPVRTRYATLAAARKVVPTIKGLDDDWNSRVLQFALDQAGVSGDVVALPPGTYPLGGKLEVKSATDGWRLIGTGSKSNYSANEGGTVLRFVGLSGDAIECLGSEDVSGRKVFSIRDVYIESNACAGNGIVITNSQRYSDLHNVCVKGFARGAGLKIGSTWVGRFRDVQCRENRIGLEFFQSTINALDFYSCYFSQNRSYGIAFNGSGVTTVNFFGGAVEGNGQGQINGAQIYCNSPVSTALNFYGVYFEWGNKDANNDETLIRVGSKPFASQSMMMLGCQFTQTNLGAFAFKESALQNVNITLISGAFSKPPPDWFSGAATNGASVRVEGMGGKIAGFGTGNDVNFNGKINLSEIQTSDPLVSGQLWADPADGYSLKVSQGPQP
jgi:hypothetical protein